MKRAWLLVVLCVICIAGVSGQSAEQEVQKALQDGNDAAWRADKAAYARFLADDLWWVENGHIETKQQRVDRLLKPGNSPKISDIKVRVYGDAAIVIATLTTGVDGIAGRTMRTLVKRDGGWAARSGLYDSDQVTAPM